VIFELRHCGRLTSQEVIDDGSLGDELIGIGSIAKAFEFIDLGVQSDHSVRPLWYVFSFLPLSRKVLQLIRKPYGVI
jgi:hypothetical protein